MSSVFTGQLPKLTAIPRPTQATHKPRQYPELKTRKPKNNWSRYNVLPAIREEEFDDITKKENELQDSEPTPYSEISDSEFLYDEMTAAWEDMFEREASMKIIREKAFIQYLELNSDHIDWVIKLAHNNVWVPVKESGIPKIISIDQSSDGLKMHVPSPPNYPKGDYPNIDNPKPFVPKPPFYSKNGSPTSLGTRNKVLELHDDRNDQLGTKLKLENIVPKPPSYPKNRSPTGLRTKNVVLELHHDRNDQLGTKLKLENNVAKPPSYPKNRSPTSLRTKNVVLELHDDRNDQLGTKLKLENNVPEPTSYPKNDLSFRLNSEGSELKPLDRLIHCTKDMSPITGKTKIFAPKPPAERKDKSPIRGRPETMKCLPTPPAHRRDSNRHSRKVRKPDIVTQLAIPSSKLSPISEIPSPRTE